MVVVVGLTPPVLLVVVVTLTLVVLGSSTRISTSTLLTVEVVGLDQFVALISLKEKVCRYFHKWLHYILKIYKIELIQGDQKSCLGSE